MTAKQITRRNELLNDAAEATKAMYEAIANNDGKAQAAAAKFLNKTNRQLANLK